MLQISRSWRAGSQPRLPTLVARIREYEVHTCEAGPGSMWSDPSLSHCTVTAVSAARSSPRDQLRVAKPVLLEGAVTVARAPPENASASVESLHPTRRTLLETKSSLKFATRTSKVAT